MLNCLQTKLSFLNKSHNAYPFLTAVSIDAQNVVTLFNSQNNKYAKSDNDFNQHAPAIYNTWQCTSLNSSANRCQDQLDYTKIWEAIGHLTTQNRQKSNAKKKTKKHVILVCWWQGRQTGEFCHTPDVVSGFLVDGQIEGFSCPENIPIYEL